MKLIIRLLVASAIAFILAQLLPGVHVDGYGTAIWFAIALGILNTLLRPILIILTFPITILTLGLFLLVINTITVMLAGELVGRFTIDGFWYGFLFSLLYSLSTSLLFSAEYRQKKEK